MKSQENYTLLNSNNYKIRPKKKILIIEDSCYMRRRLKDILLFGGYDVIHEAEDGELGLELVKSNFIDLVTLDIILPGINGLEVLKEIRLIKPDLPVIIISSIMRASVYAEALKLGANDFIMKPFNEEVIQYKLQKIFVC